MVDKARTTSGQSKPRSVSTRVSSKKSIQTDVAGTNSKQLTSQQRIEMIKLAAYYRALRRGFSDGNPEQDWYDAEREVDSKLTKAS